MQIFQSSGQQSGCAASFLRLHLSVRLMCCWALHFIGCYDVVLVLLLFIHFLINVVQIKNYYHILCAEPQCGSIRQTVKPSACQRGPVIISQQQSVVCMYACRYVCILYVYIYVQPSFVYSHCNVLLFVVVMFWLMLAFHHTTISIIIWDIRWLFSRKIFNSLLSAGSTNLRASFIREEGGVVARLLEG